MMNLRHSTIGTHHLDSLSCEVFWQTLYICHQNWDLVKDVVSLDAKDKDNKRVSTKWIRELNEIRKITTHPERGVLTTDQVAFVNELLDKAEEYFPEDISQTQAVS